MIFNSRTFCLYEDIEKLKKMNLGLGGSLDNAIVIKQNKVLNNGDLEIILNLLIIKSLIVWVIYFYLDIK